MHAISYSFLLFVSTAGLDSSAMDAGTGDVNCTPSAPIRFVFDYKPDPVVSLQA